MKISMGILSVMVILLVGCGNDKQPDETAGYDISGTINGINEGVIKLMSYNQDDRSSTTLDSASFKNASFHIEGKHVAPQMVTVMIEPGNWSFNAFIENNKLTFTIDTTNASHYDYSMYGGNTGAQIKNFTESGSANFDDWQQYQNDSALHAFDNELSDLRNKVQTTKDIDLQYKYRDQMDSVVKMLNAVRLNYIKQYVHEKPTAVAGAYMLRDLYNWYSEMPVADMEALVNTLKGEAKESTYYSSLSEIIAKRKAVMPGSVAPDFTLLKRDSSQFTLSSTRGNYVMIDFWASWCHPCRKAIPHWKKVYDKYHAKGFEIVSVSDDSRWNDWFKAMDQEKMPWTQVCDEFPVKNMPARVGSLYMTTYIPFYVLLDKEGKILVYSGDETKIDKKLEELFGS